MTNTYTDMIRYATAHDLTVKYNIKVPGTRFTLLAHLPDFDAAFVNGSADEEKMKVIQDITGIKRLMVWVPEEA